VSSRSHRRQDSAQAGPAKISPAKVSTGRDGPARLGWALLVIAAAVIGGLAAATLVDASVVVAVIVSVVVGGIGVVALFRSPARSPELTGPQDPPTAPGMRRLAPSAATPVARDGQDRGGPPALNETVVQMLPLPSQPEGPDAPWWDSAQGAPPPPSPGGKRAPAPDLSTYLAATFIAQCPRCGGFRLDIRRGGSAWDFRCESCEYTWTWQPGTSWPPVRVMPP
jgi:hypothetical protein